MTHETPFDNRGTPRDRPLSLALLATELAVGGAERCLVQLAIGLTRRGHRVEVYSLRPPPPPDRDSLVRRLAAEGIPTCYLGLRSFASLPGVLLRLRARLARQRPDWLQTFLFHANVLGAIAARTAGVPALATGVRVADPRRWRLSVERLATRRAAAIVCVSRSVAEYLRDAGGYPAARLNVIANGVDVAAYDVPPAPPEALALAPGRRALLSIGRLDPQKGFDWLLEQAPRLLRELPEHDWRIVGDGPSRAALQAAIDAAGLADRVRLLGRRAPEELPSLLAASDVVLVPSRWEGMPNVLLEALAAARPVVATAVEGVREVLGDDSELLEQATAPGDAETFVTRAIRFAREADAHRDADGTSRTPRGRRNRRRAADAFSVDAMVSAYEAIYRGRS